MNMCLLLELGMVILGLIALITGKCSITQGLTTRGTPARIVGLILMIPLPLCVFIGIMIGLNTGGDIDKGTQAALTFVEGVIVIGCLALACVLTVVMRSPPEKRKRRRPVADGNLDEEGDYDARPPKRTDH